MGGDKVKRAPPRMAGLRRRMASKPKPVEAQGSLFEHFGLEQAPAAEPLPEVVESWPCPGCGWLIHEDDEPTCPVCGSPADESVE